VAASRIVHVRRRNRDIPDDMQVLDDHLRAFLHVERYQHRAPTCPDFHPVIDRRKSKSLCKIALSHLTLTLYQDVFRVTREIIDQRGMLQHLARQFAMAGELQIDLRSLDDRDRHGRPVSLQVTLDPRPFEAAW
jgi:hypothetical protein